MVGPVRKRMLGYVATLVVSYLVLLTLVRLFEKKLIFFPDYPGRLSGDWKPRGLPVEDVWLTTSDGVKLHAWWIPRPSADFTFLAFHGNAANIANRAEAYRFLGQLPANVLAVEYRGYGRSEGKPSEAGLYADAQAAYQYVVAKRGVPPDRVISFGQSLGTAVAVDLASKEKVGGVVLEAPFPSGSAVARRVYPFLPGLSLLVRGQFDTASKLAKIRAPILVVHCTHDPVLAFELGEEVYRLAPSPKLFVRIDGYCHEEAAMAAPEQYRQQLLAFLQSLQAKIESDR